ncbi:23S rRNA (adenine(2030)-N(6))-methyltransferase RlmJ [Sphaerotilus sp.]|uniref:23S rRNA (adenine(2030)-N(6))-methyltransferase RlmJ n=1 Tax=Sphaerotilus sp. TaxID=2093942 RepID=UPI002ACE06B1|nr:23S rRNA (adenine(2030)-N(6))-methyltransferase RlmJ [Sphaerotilus sp.]MDZ7858423.1 23S rRNA (adenine(2030)-N(6))-methyltransferase RlmJ [Sphaerotilus sp.]
MLAYRHAFHAGNHADVLKHLVFTQVLRYMAEKDKPFTLVDTHAGAGGYGLDSNHARKHAEYDDGVGRLFGRKDLPAALNDYLALVRRFNPQPDRLTRYPGSPALAQMLLRADDRMRLYELHSTDFPLLQTAVEGRRETAVMNSDGFAGLKAEMPPPSRRGVVLIDPSYEIKTDYAKVVATVRDALTRFPEAVILVWYPQLQRLEPKEMTDRLKAAADAQSKRGWVHVRMSVAEPDQSGFGMLGSGMLVINPPFVLHTVLQEVMPVLTETLGQYAGASFVLEKRSR